MDSAERIAAAVATLDPESRALVELSARRGLSDEDIAGALGVPEDEVTRRRSGVLEQIGSSVGADRDEVGERLPRLSEDEWNGRAAREPARPQRPTAGTGRPGRIRPLFVALLAVAVVAVVLVVALSGDDGGSGGAASKQSSSSSGSGSSGGLKPASPESQGVRMQRLNGTYGRGTAQITGSKLHLKVSSFLQPQGGGYAVWLYNSRDDAKRLYSTTKTSIDRDIPLPDGFEKYRFVEVARAIPDLDSDHSGISLLRARVSELSP